MPLPAKRWAVASRWANEDNNLVPTLLAWDPEEGKLDDDEYQSLAKLLHRADVEGTLKGLGHVEAVQTLNVPEPSRRIPGDLWLRVGERLIEPGFAAVLGPIGIHPLRRRDDLDRVRRIRELSLDIAVASLSSRYARMFVGGSDSFDEGELGLAHKAALDSDERFAQRDGLTVAWPAQDQDIAFVDD